MSVTHKIIAILALRQIAYENFWLRESMAILNYRGNSILLTSIPSKKITTCPPTVLVFDSGVGGLSIYTEVQKLLPHLHYIYTFDNAAHPYGEKSEEFITDRVLKITSAIQRRHYMIMMIIACNTASTTSLSELRKHFHFPIIGVVPAIKLAAHITSNGVIGLLATNGTIQRSYTRTLIARFASSCKIEMLGSSALVELAEAKLHGESVSLVALKNILHPWLTMTKPPDTVVLGCTHFPLLEEELTIVLPIGTRLVDSSSAIARHAAWIMSMKESLPINQEENFAYCIRLHKKTDILLPVLQKYGFKKLKKLSL